MNRNTRHFKMLVLPNFIYRINAIPINKVLYTYCQTSPKCYLGREEIWSNQNNTEDLEQSWRTPTTQGGVFARSQVWHGERSTGPTHPSREPGNSLGTARAQISAQEQRHFNAERTDFPTNGTETNGCAFAEEENDPNRTSRLSQPGP